MKDRIKMVRQQASLSQRAFGAAIGVSGPSIAHLESGSNHPSAQTIKLICQQFHVRRDWLVYGTGPMMLPDAEDDAIIDEVLSGEDEFIKAVIRGIAKTPGGWEKMREVFQAISQELQNNPDA